MPSVRRVGAVRRAHRLRDRYLRVPALRHADRRRHRLPHERPRQRRHPGDDHRHQLHPRRQAGGDLRRRGRQRGELHLTDEISATSPPSAKGSGSADILVTSADGQQVNLPAAFSYYYGNESFSEQFLYGADGPYSVATGDLNADGTPDMVVSHMTTGNVAVFLGQGGGLFAAPTYYATGKNPTQVAVVQNLYGDGNAGVVVVNSGDNTISVMFGNGTGGLRAAAHYPISGGAQLVSTVDLNGDLKPNLTLASTGDNSVVVFAGGSSGYFVAGAPLPLSGVTFRNVAVADFNKDGLPDLVFDDIATNKLSYFQNATAKSAAPSFNAPVATGITVQASGFTAFDANNDGNIDLVASSTFMAGPGVAFYAGNGDGTFKAPVITSIFGPPMTFLSGTDGSLKSGMLDFNKDGNADLLMQSSSRFLYMLLGHGDGTFGQTNTLMVDPRGGTPTRPPTSTATARATCSSPSRTRAAWTATSRPPGR